jgi:ATP-binding cassette subfamily B protein
MLSDELQKLLAYVRPYRWSLVLATLFLLMESATSLAVPWLAGQLVSALLQAPSGLRISLSSLILLLLGLCVVQALSSFTMLSLASRTAERLIAALRVHIYTHLQALPLDYHHQHRHGEALALLTRDVEILSWFMSGSLLSVVPSLLTFSGAMILMIRIDFWLGVLAALSVPLCFILLKVLGRRLRLLAQQLAQEHATAVAIVEDHLHMLPAIKAFTYEAYASERYRSQIRRIIDLTMSQLCLRVALGPLIQCLTAVGIVLLCWLSAQRVLAGTLTPGALISFLLYGLILARPMSVLAGTYGQLQQARGAITRLLDVLGTASEPPGPYTQSLHRVRGAIEFRGVHFAYPGREALLHDLYLHIAVGETVALTGPNGAGKSTLGYLLMRFYEPQAGQICIDGIDITTVSLTSLRRQIGLVTQQPLLFNSTVRDNLAYGKPHATQAEMEVATKAARAHNFIMQLPAGYDTRIGDNGVKLSGGQQQRLCLARALLKEPPILILDEATTMYDPEGEREMLDACRELLRQRTVIIITHHPSSLALADRVLRLECGTIHEGTVLHH